MVQEYSNHETISDIGKLVIEDSIKTGIPVIWPESSQIRTNSRCIWQVPAVEMEIIWQRINGFVPDTVIDSNGINRRLRFFKTDVNQEFKPHIDQSSARIHNGVNECSFYTLVVWLNGDYSCGEISFANSSIASIPYGGILFAQDGLANAQVHSGLPVKNGIKYLLRSDIFYKPMS